MLIQFSIENHRSIKNTAVISFAASKDKSLESYLLHPDEKRTLLPALALYGANAAGKTGQHQALANQSGGLVTQLCQRYLQAAFRCTSALSKDIQNQRGAVNYLDTGDVF